MPKESWIQDAIDDLTHDLMEKYNKEKVIVYNTAQMYRHDRLAFLEKMFAEAKTKGYHYGVKLVRGAYMEKERDRAEERNYPSPIQPDKASSDRDFDAALELCLKNIDHTALVAGSHNEKSAFGFSRLNVETWRCAIRPANLLRAAIWNEWPH